MYQFIVTLRYRRYRLMMTIETTTTTEHMSMLLLSARTAMWSSPVVLTESEFDRDSKNRVTSRPDVMAFNEWHYNVTLWWECRQLLYFVQGFDSSKSFVQAVYNTSCPYLFDAGYYSTNMITIRQWYDTSTIMAILDTFFRIIEIRN